MKKITQDDVVKYEMGLMTDPAERRAVEQARGYDPLVRYWFSLCGDQDRKPLPAVFRRMGAKIAERVHQAEPSKEHDRVWRTKVGYESMHVVGCEIDFDDGSPRIPVWKPVAELPSHVLDPVSHTVRLIYPAAEAPYGVARVVADIDGQRYGNGELVAFPVTGDGDHAIAEAEVAFADLGIPVGKHAAIRLYVVFATDDNLGEFPPNEVAKLLARCNGNPDKHLAVRKLIRRLGLEGRS